MKNPALRLCLLLLVLAVLAPFHHAVAQTVPGQRDALHSNILNEERTIQVLLPAGYSPGSKKRYDVLYLLDGDGNAPLAHGAGVTVHHDGSAVAAPLPL